MTPTRRPTPRLFRRPLRAALTAPAALLLVVPLVGGAPAAAPAAAPVGTVFGGTPACPASLPPTASPAPVAAPKRVEMTATARAPGARGTMTVRMGDSPYGVAVDGDGSYRLRIEVVVEGLPSRGNARHVAWVATPELDRHRRLGALGGEGRVEGEVAWNKFIVFVTRETTPEPETWSREILLSALSPSGRMHTMAGHGPFSGEPCLDPRS